MFSTVASKIPVFLTLDYCFGLFGASDEQFPPVPVNLLEIFKRCVRFVAALASGDLDP